MWRHINRSLGDMNNGSKTLILFGVWIWVFGYYLSVWNLQTKVLLCYCIVAACTISVIESDNTNDTIFDRVLLLNRFNKMHYRRFAAFLIGFPGLFALDFNLTGLGSIMLVIGGLYRLGSGEERSEIECGYDTCYTMV